MRLALVLILCALAAWPAAAQDTALLRFGRQLYARGDYEMAARTLEQAAAGAALGASDLVLLGFAYMQMDRLADAERTLAQARAQAPREPLVALAQGQLAFLRRRYGEAAGLFREARQAAPESKEARRGLVSSLVNLGVEAYQQGRPQDSAAHFREALDVDPHSTAALQNLAALELEAGRLAEAAPLVERACALEPANPSALRLLVRLREHQGRLVEALDSLRTLAHLAPRDAVGAALLGRALEQSGSTSEAMKAFARAEQLDTEDAYPYYRLAQAAAERGETERALVLVRQAIGKAVQQTSLLQLQAMKRVQGAGGQLRPDDVEELERLAQRGEEPSELLRESLELLRSLHTDPRAYEGDLRLLCSWYPHSRPLLAALGELLLDQARWEEALAQWQRLVALMATAAEGHAGVARALEGGGRIEEARQAWVRVLDLESGDPAVFDALQRVCGDGEELRQILLDRSYIETRNTLLLRRLAALERRLGLAGEADRRELRIQES